MRKTDIICPFCGKNLYEYDTGGLNVHCEDTMCWWKHGSGEEKLWRELIKYKTKITDSTQERVIINPED